MKHTDKSSLGSELVGVDLLLADGRRYELDAKSIEQCVVESKVTGYGALAELRVTLVVRLYPGIRVSREPQEESAHGADRMLLAEPDEHGADRATPL